MNSDLVELKVKNDNVIDVDLQTEIIRLKDRMKSLEELCNTRCNSIEDPINELLKTILQKLQSNIFAFRIFYTYIYIYKTNLSMTYKGMYYSVSIDKRKAYYKHITNKTRTYTNKGIQNKN